MKRLISAMPIPAPNFLIRGLCAAYVAAAGFSPLLADGYDPGYAPYGRIDDRAPVVTNAWEAVSNKTHSLTEHAYLAATSAVPSIVTNNIYGEWQFDGTSWVECGLTPDEQYLDNIPTTLLSLNWYYSLDDVPQAAKNIFADLYIEVTESILPVCYAVYTVKWSDLGWDRSGLMTNGVAGCNNTYLPFTETTVTLTSDAYDYGFELTRKTYNSLGLARLSEVTPSNALEGHTFDFSTQYGLYSAVSNLVILFGGSITNFPALP